MALASIVNLPHHYLIIQMGNVHRVLKTLSTKAHEKIVFKGKPISQI